MANNEILRFAFSPTANVQSQASYDSDGRRTVGSQGGTISDANFVNKTKRQTSLMSAGLAQFIADYQLQDVTDDLTEVQIAQYLFNAIGGNSCTAQRTSSCVYVESTGTANAIILNPANPYSATNHYVAGSTITFKANATNTGATTVDISGLGVKDIKVVTPVGLLDTISNQIFQGGIYDLIYDGVDFQLVDPSTSITQIFTAKLGITAGPGGGFFVPIGSSPIRLGYNATVLDPFSWIVPAQPRFLPTIPGKYRIDVSTFVDGFQLVGSSTQVYSVMSFIYKNSAILNASGGLCSSTTASRTPIIGGGVNAVMLGAQSVTSTIVEADGTTDYFEVFVSAGGTASNIRIRDRQNSGDPPGTCAYFQMTYLGV